MQTGRTTWEEQSRVESGAGSPLTEQGAMAVQDAAKELPANEITAVYACTSGEAERQTAELLAKALRLKVRDNKRLRDLDYGLWQGLTMEEIKRRQPRVFRQWTKAPGSVRPPKGETLTEAQDRLRDALKKILKRQKNGSALLVLRPVALGLVKCLTRNEAVDALWQHVDMSFRWSSFEMDPKSL